MQLGEEIIQEPGNLVYSFGRFKCPPADTLMWWLRRPRGQSSILTPVMTRVDETRGA